MTFDEVRAIGKVAQCQLPEGVLLRYDATDRTVRKLPYPGIPGQWREAVAYDGPVPPTGWTHYRGCDCRVCRAESAEGPSESERASA